MAIVAQVVRRYDHYFDTRPILTMMVTNSVYNHPSVFCYSTS